ncbi:MAG: aminotransferase class III-fold pyridoxal phosphate-dependent enzyme, partial [Candidatus Lindowbacteria bacterium]|nr:aminotransferase class III-fold pyridoxal phosphate-dependent enzyme [Candidatus Lindowbacteria bacterium]
FFCNSGAEANEAAIKLARKWGHTIGNGVGIVTLKRSFHGRTIATITATGQEKFQRNFHPLLEGFKYAALNDLKSVEAVLEDTDCAIMFELVQAEGGVHVATKEFAKGIRKLCDERNLLMILDEVQTGMGRTGRLFAYQHFGVKPDIISLAKSLAGGVPMGAMLAGPKVADIFQPGDHASTFGGNPLASAAALATIGVMTTDGFLKNVRTLSKYLLANVKKIARKHSFIKEVRGLGMLMGIEFDVPVKKAIGDCLKRGLIVGTAGENVMRLLPPLTATKAEIDEALAVIEEVLEIFKDESAQA